MTTKDLHCDMNRECAEPISMIDDRGFVYCAGHGIARRGGGARCRKLTRSEIKSLQAGQSIRY